MNDKIVDDLIEKINPNAINIITEFKLRSAIGIQKYGTTLEENNKDNYFQHLKEELMDASLYIEKLISRNKAPDYLVSLQRLLVGTAIKINKEKIIPLTK